MFYGGSKRKSTKIITSVNLTLTGCENDHQKETKISGQRDRETDI